MNTRQLGKIGLVFLGVYLVVSSLSAIPSSVGGLWMAGFEPTGSDIAEALIITLGVFVLFALLPGLWIISRRDRLAHSWFADHPDSQTSIEPQTLLAVGLVLIGVTTLIAGLTLVPRALMQISGLLGGGKAAVGTSVEAGVHLALGIVLIRASKPLSAKFG